MADLHLGGWRDLELEKLNLSAFEKALDTCLKEKVDFIVISGDFFDTSMPPFDVLDFVTKRLNSVKKSGIPVYTISGSHDHSPSGKTILKVLENAELITNVARGEEKDGKLRLLFTADKKTGAKLTGIFGRSGSLDVEFYKNLDRSVEKAAEKEPGYKIFLFHAGIEEYRPDYLKDVAAMPLSLLPSGFDYYAGGHIHHRSEQEYGSSTVTGKKGKVIFPGPLFPCNFAELERFGHGGFYIVDGGRPRFVELKEKEVEVIKVDADNKTAKEVEALLEEKVASLNKKDCILLIRVSGTLKEGKPADINFKRLAEEAVANGAAIVRRNTSSLVPKEYEEVKVSADSIEGLEARIIKEHLGQSGMKDEEKLVARLLKVLDTEKLEGETASAFESRLLKDADVAIGSKS